MKLIMMDDDGEYIELLHDRVGDGTTARLLELFGQAVQLQRKKAETYGSAWREQGYMGNVGRVLSKASRLRNMLWGDFQLESSEEGVMDTLLDIVNLSAFAIINYRDRNKWGVHQ